MELSWKKWKKGDPHLINRIQWDSSEKASLEKVLEADWFAGGKIRDETEKKLAQAIKIPNVHLTNSGSAAIQVGLMSLKHQGYWKEGDLILHPVTTFATSISSAIFLGAIPVYIDTKPQTYVADPEQVSKAIKRYPQIKGMILPYLLGSLPDIPAIKDALEDRFLLEDCCDTFGGTFDGKPIGSFGEFAAFSFYGSHHVTSGGVGGALVTTDKLLHEIAKSVIYWGRNFKEGDAEFLKRYNYETIGTDSQMSNLLAVFLNAQLDRIPGFIKARAQQFKEMTALFEKADYFHLPVVHPKADPAWFSYPLTIKENAPFTRDEFARYLTKNKIEARPLMCGNIMEQRPFRNVTYVALDERFPVAEEIEKRSLFIPCWGMPEEQKADYYNLINKFFESRSSRSAAIGAVDLRNPPQYLKGKKE